LEDFDRRVATLASGMNGTPEYLPCPPDRTGVGDSTRRVSYRYLPHSGGRSLQSTLSAVALCELERALNPMSLWWTDGSNDIGPTALCVSGLPDPEAFAAMLCRQSPAPE
jgi:hypothetical protein